MRGDSATRTCSVRQNGRRQCSGIGRNESGDAACQSAVHDGGGSDNSSPRAQPWIDLGIGPDVGGRYFPAQHLSP